MKDKLIIYKITYLACVGMLVLLCGCGAKTDSLEMLLAENGKQVAEQTNTARQDTSPGDTEPTDGQAEGQEQTLRVHICGYVRVPGIYEMPADARLYDLLMAAGGFAEGANKDVLNLAEYLADGNRIYVPGESAQAQGTAGETEATNGLSEQAIAQAALQDTLININTASQSLLETLPGIGPAKAQEIIAYRTANGPFDSIEGIMEVTGIKEALFERLKPFVTVKGS